MKYLITTIAALVVVGCGPSISIHKAAEEGNIYVVKQHLAAGADVNAKNKYGDTPLHYAAWMGDKEIVELLIARGANVNARNFSGFGEHTPLRNALFAGHKEIAELLIANGAKVNPKFSMGRTILHEVAYEGLKEAAELLIANGAKVNVKDNIIDSTPVHAAFLSKNIEVIDLLIANGADVNAKSRTGATPLGWVEYAPQKYPRIRAIFDKHGIKYGKKLKAFKAACN